MKYLIFESEQTGIHPIVFDNNLNHCDVAAQITTGALKLKSAGFVQNQGSGVWEAGGYSVSLALSSREIDTPILSLFMNEGLSGLNLRNYAVALSMGLL